MVLKADLIFAAVNDLTGFRRRGDYSKETRVVLLKRPSYRVVVKEKQSKRDGAYLENVGTYNPTREPAEINLNMDRVRYWIANGAQPTDTVSRLIKANSKNETVAEAAIA
jgi:small subunit ribosomal protein S16